MNRFFQYRLDHVLFWALTIFFHGYTRLNVLYTAGAGQFFLELAIRSVLLAGVIYATQWVVIPRLTEGKRIAMALIVLVASIGAYILLKNSHDVYLFGEIMGDSSRLKFFSNSLYNFSIVLFYLAFATALHLSKQWYLQRELIRKIEVEKLNTELEYLRAQINPHFLFNSINTIYFQIDKQNHAARETLGKFSEMLRYQLYECNGKEIAIEKELQYLKNYVELQRLRKDENCLIEFSDTGLSDFSLPPLLLIPFVENAFKHVSVHTAKENEIRITLARKEGWFTMTVFNTYDATLETPREAGGIGMKNVARRLELLYHDRYTLDVRQAPENYSVTLEIPVL